LQTLLNTAESDDVDALQASIDEQFVEAFSKSDGGTLWHFHQESDKSARPSDTELGYLRDLNNAQALSSTLTREFSTQRWQLFAQWWSYGMQSSINDVLT
jgi:hypothetical protein